MDSRAIEVNFDTGDVMGGFWNLYRATNKRFLDTGMLIDINDYKKGGYTFWAFNLSPSQCDEQFNDPARQGTLSLELEFERDRAEALGVCVYLQFNSEIILNESREVITMY